MTLMTTLIMKMKHLKKILRKQRDQALMMKRKK